MKNAIGKFIFVSDNPIKADLIIVPGSSHKQLPLKAIELYQKGFSRKIIFTGGYNNKLGQIESEFGQKLALSNGVKAEDIITETVSGNTKENAREAFKLVNKYKLPGKTILLISKSYHARRLKMTFARVFNKSRLLIIPVKDNLDISRENWWKDEEKKAKIYEEIRKIVKYFIKGRPFVMFWKLLMPGCPTSVA